MKKTIWIAVTASFLVLAGCFASLKPKFSFHTEDFGFSIWSENRFDHWSVSICDGNGYVSSSESPDGWKMYPVYMIDTPYGNEARHGYRWPHFRHTHYNPKAIQNQDITIQ